MTACFCAYIHAYLLIFINDKIQYIAWSVIIMGKFMKIMGCIFAVIGFVCVVKHIMYGCKEGYCLCGWFKRKGEEEKPKVDEEKSTGATASYKIKVEDEERTGSRYGSNPIRY